MILPPINLIKIDEGRLTKVNCNIITNIVIGSTEYITSLPVSLIFKISPPKTV